jgi:hypothetical protein
MPMQPMPGAYPGYPPSAYPPPQAHPIRQLFAGTIAALLQGASGGLVGTVTQGLNGAITAWFNRKQQQVGALAYGVPGYPGATPGAYPQTATSYPQAGVTYPQAGSTTYPQTTTYPQGATTYPQSTTAYPGATSTYPQATATYPQTTATYPQGTTAYPQSATTYPQATTTYPAATTYPGATSTYPQATATYPQTTATYPQGTTAYPQSATTYPQATTTYPAATTYPGATTYPQATTASPQTATTYPTATQVFDPQTGQASTAAVAAPAAGSTMPTLFAGVAYEVHALGPGGSDTQINAATYQFRTGDQFKVYFRPSTPGRMDVYNINPLGQQTLIDSVSMAAGQLTTLGPYAFTATTGDESLRLVLTPCATAQLLASTRDIVNVSSGSQPAPVTLPGCSATASRGVALATRDIQKVAVDGSTSFALDPIAQSELAAGQVTPRAITIYFHHI